MSKAKLIAVACLMGASLVNAQLKLYVGASGGVGLMQDVDFDLSAPQGTGSGSFTMNEGAVANLAIGATFDNIPVRTEFEAGWQKNNVDELVGAGGSISSSGDQETITYMWNIYLELRDNISAELGEVGITPFVFAGIGAADIDDDISIQFAYQFGAGLAYSVTENISFDLRYKYLATEDFDYSEDGVKLDVDGLQYNQFLLGIRYTF